MIVAIHILVITASSFWVLRQRCRVCRSHSIPGSSFGCIHNQTRDRSTVRAGLSRKHTSQSQQALLDYFLYLFTHFAWRRVQ
jgi:hypothetical protein